MLNQNLLSFQNHGKDMKTYDFKIEGRSFSIWDTEKQEWIDIPRKCTYYTTIPSRYYNTYYGQDAPAKGNKSCKVDEESKYAIRAAAKEYIRVRLKGRKRSFFEFPFRRNK